MVFLLCIWKCNPELPTWITAPCPSCWYRALPRPPSTHSSTCELGEHLSFLGGSTDAGRQWFQRVYFRNRKRLPNDRLAGGGLHLIGYAGRSPSADLFCHFVVCWGDNKMLVSSWWQNYVLCTKCGRKFWPGAVIAWLGGGGRVSYAFIWIKCAFSLQGSAYSTRMGISVRHSLCISDRIL